jgi:hypothetical protein
LFEPSKISIDVPTEEGLDVVNANDLDPNADYDPVNCHLGVMSGDEHPTVMCDLILGDYDEFMAEAKFSYQSTYGCELS